MADKNPVPRSAKIIKARLIRNRKSISLKQKFMIIQCFESGLSKADICEEFNMNESTVRSILKKAEEYKKRNQWSTVRTRNIAMLKMEELLVEWLKECHTNKEPLTRNEIKEKALDLFNGLKKNLIEKGNADVADVHFIASSGWLNRFKSRYRFDTEPTDIVAQYMWVPSTNECPDNEIVFPGESCEFNENEENDSNEDETHEKFCEINNENIVNIKEEISSESFDEKDPSILIDNAQADVAVEANFIDTNETRHHEDKINSNHDVLEVFFTTMAATVRKFTPFHQHLAKTKIFQIVSEIELSQLTESARNNHGGIF